MSSKRRFFLIQFLLFEDLTNQKLNLNSRCISTLTLGYANPIILLTVSVLMMINECPCESFSRINWFGVHCTGLGSLMNIKCMPDLCHFSKINMSRYIFVFYVNRNFIILECSATRGILMTILNHVTNWTVSYFFTFLRKRDRKSVV